MLTPFGERMRELRLSRNVTLRKLAAALGVDPSFLSGIEHGRRSAPDSILSKIASFFKLDASGISDLRKTAQENKTLKRLNEFSDEQLHAAFARKFGADFNTSSASERVDQKDGDVDE
jgi:transcriptional regulator with XRE-family HTH domain